MPDRGTRAALTAVHRSPCRAPRVPASSVPVSWGCRPVELAVKPCPRDDPIPFHRRRGYAEDLSRIFNRKSAEKFQFNDLSLLRIELRERFQCIVQGDHIHVRLLGALFGLFQSQLTSASATLVGAMGSRMVHEDLPHQLCRDCEKMSAVLPLGNLLIRETYIRLVNQSGALQGMSGALVA